MQIIHESFCEIDLYSRMSRVLVENSIMANSKLQDVMHVLDGLVLPKFVEQETLDKLMDLTLHDDDVWIVSYPKAGTTWTQYIVQLIHSGGKDDGRKVSDAVPWIEAGEAECQITVEDMIPPRAFKSHMPYEKMPCGPPNSTPAKYIYVARNPKDLATSFFHHCCAYHVPGLQWKEFFECFLSGMVEFGDYFDHVLGWWSHRNDENVLFMKFEDMKCNPVSTITRIATFVGFPNLSQEVITAIAEKTSFDKMRRNDKANYSWSTDRDPQAPPFLRKGIVGDWKNQFSMEDSERLEKICHDRLRGSGLEFYFGE